MYLPLGFQPSVATSDFHPIEPRERPLLGAMPLSQTDPVADIGRVIDKDVMNGFPFFHLAAVAVCVHVSAAETLALPAQTRAAASVQICA